MAKAKANTDVPAGMRQVQTGNFPAFFDFEKRKAIHGKILAIRSMNVTRGSGKKARTEKVGVLSIAELDGGEVFSVGESAALEGLFKEAKTGQTVFIRYEGKKQMKKGQNPMRMFASFLK